MLASTHLDFAPIAWCKHRRLPKELFAFVLFAHDQTKHLYHGIVLTDDFLQSESEHRRCTDANSARRCKHDRVLKQSGNNYD